MPTPVSALLHAATLVTAGIYLWATVRAFKEMFQNENNPVEWAEGDSTHSNTAKIGGQQPVLKRTLRSIVVKDEIHREDEVQRIKRGLNAIRFLWMRLNYQNSSLLGQNTVYIWEQLLHVYHGTIEVNKYYVGNSYIVTLLIGLRTGDKRVSIEIIVQGTEQGVINATGEVHIAVDDRGPVVPRTRGKGPKHLGNNTAKIITRSYTTKCKKNRSVPIMERPRLEVSRDYEILAKH